MKNANSKWDAIILAGGRGTRLSSVVKDTPKPLALVEGRPFLDYILNELADAGVVERVILSLGYQGEKVIEYYRKHPSPIPLVFSQEETPLGTGGAVLQAMRKWVLKEHFFVLNGDSLLRVNFSRMIRNHLLQKSGVTLALTQVAQANRYGSVRVQDKQVKEFLEKQGSDCSGLINAGVYLFHRKTLDPFLQTSCSLERDLFPILVSNGLVFAEVMEGPFIDIGVPDTYLAASQFIKEF